MSRFASADPVPVRVGDCQCPGTPHEDGDVVMLRPRLGFAAGLEALGSIKALGLEDIGEGNAADALGSALAPVYIRHGVVDWNFLDAAGERIEVTPEAIADLDWPTAYAIADKADDLYGAQLLSPLVERLRTSSQPGQTVVSMSVKRPSGSQRRTRSA